MKSENRIPTVLGIFLIAFSLLATVFLFNNARRFLSQASVDVAPDGVKISNISDTGFSVSWKTDRPTSGTVNYGNGKLENLAVDDRDTQTGKLGQYTAHHVTLRFLQPLTQYQFEILSGGKTFNNNGEPFVLKTLDHLSKNTQIQPAYGTVKTSEHLPAENTLVYLTLNSGFVYSTLTKSSGSWLITFLSDQPASPEEKVNLLFDAGQTSEVITTADKVSPLPEITLGKNYDFRVLGASTFKIFNPLSSGSSVVEAATPSATPLSSPTPTPTPLIFASRTATPAGAPTSGNLTPTLFLLLGALFLIILGTGKLLLKNN